MLRLDFSFLGLCTNKRCPAARGDVMGQFITNESGEDQKKDRQFKSGYSAPPSRFLGQAASLSAAIMRTFNSLVVKTFATSRYWKGANTRPRVLLTLDKSQGSLDLLITNRSPTSIWVEEAKLLLGDVEAD